MTMQFSIECAVPLKILLLRSFHMFQHIVATYWCATDLSFVLEYARPHKYCTICPVSTTFVKAFQMAREQLQYWQNNTQVECY